MRFSLRSILFSTMLFSIAMAFIAINVRQRSAKLQWLDAAQATKLLPPSTTRVSDIGASVFQFSFRPQHTDVRQIVKDPMPTGSYSLIYKQDELVAKCDNEKFADLLLDQFNKNDALSPGNCIIRGLIQDSNGAAVPNARIDVLGATTSINYFRSREDGSFLIVFPDATSVSGKEKDYHLQISGPNNALDTRNRWVTPSFRFNENEMEKDVIIRVPWKPAE